MFFPHILGGSSIQSLDKSSNLGKALRKNNVSTNQIMMSVIHKDVATSLDISGYTVKYSVNGINNDTGTFTKTATNKGLFGKKGQ